MGPARRLLAAAPVIPFLAVLWTSIGMAGPASASVVVDVRVEGAANTLYEGSARTTAHRVDGGDGTGYHACSGPVGEEPGPTLTGALDDALRTAGLPWLGTWSGSSGDFFIESIAGEDSTPAGPWSMLLNGKLTPVGGCSAGVRNGDRVLLARDVVFTSKTLMLTGATTVRVGERIRLAVTDERDDDAPVAGATIAGSDDRAGDPVPPVTTGGTGTADLTIGQPGTYRFKATHPHGIRSNAVTVCVGVNGCETDPPPQGPPVRILKIDDGQRFLRGASPRILRGRLNAGSGVRLALRHRQSRKCRSWAGGKRRLVRKRCNAKPIWFKPSVDDGRWAYRLGHLPPGRYRLLGRAIGTPSVKWRKGVNQVGFTVRRDRLSRAGLARKAARYVARAASRRDVRESGLYSAWTTLALGLRQDRRAGQATRALMAKRANATATGELARNVAALQALRRGPARLRREAGIKRRTGMIKELKMRQSPDGSFDTNVNLTAMAILALPRTGTAAVAAADWLEGRQGAGGGFGFAAGSPADTDTTGLAAWVLARAGRGGAARRSASYLRSLQNHDGGFPSMPGGTSNVQSTGLAMAGLRAGRYFPAWVRTEDGITPFHYLATVQRRNGRLDYAPGRSVAPAWVTAQGLIGLTQRGRLIAGP